MLRCEGVPPGWSWADVKDENGVSIEKPASSPKVLVRDPNSLRPNWQDPITSKRLRPQMERTCDMCGLTFLKNVNQVKEGRRDFCSRACFGAAQRVTSSKDPHAKLCPKCDKLHSKQGIFCSHACANGRGPRTDAFKKRLKETWEAKMQPVYEERGYACTPSQKAKTEPRSSLPSRTCDGCSTIFQRRRFPAKAVKFYCSRQCKGQATQIRLSIQCPGCSRAFLPANGLQKHCSMSCSHKASYQKFIQEWLDGLHSVSTTERVPPRIRRYLFEVNESRCCSCGWSKVHSVTGKIPLTVNHINGNPYDNTPSNLELICPCCHSLTPNYCGLNKGSGRKKRLQKLQSEQTG